MEYRRLGDCGVKVSPLCLGTMTFGEPDETAFMHQVGCDEPTSFAIMDAALDAGINFFDTADVYGNDGLTEKIIGRWLQQSQQRDHLVLATKFRFRMGPGINGVGASRYRIIRCVEESLRRLQTDRIDLYQIHMQDWDTPEEETLRALDDLISAGKILYIGASNYAAYRLLDSLWTSRTQHLNHFVTLQAQYSLMVRDIEREHVPVCRKYGLGILPWSPLAGGFLSGKYKADRGAPKGSRLAKWQERFSGMATPRGWRVLETLDSIAQELDTSSACVALAWLLSKPAVSSVIFGARSIAQLSDNLRALDVTLPTAAKKQLDAASALDLGYPYDFIASRQPEW